MLMVLLLASMFSVITQATVYFEEDFSTEGWQSRWIQPPPGEFGDWRLIDSFEQGKSLLASDNQKKYSISSKFGKFSNEDKNLVIQYSSQMLGAIHCRGTYIKIQSSNMKQTGTGEEEFVIRFGPDVCGDKSTFLVDLRKDGEVHSIKTPIPLKVDHQIHVYTLVVKPNNNYEVLIDNVVVQSGSLTDGWDLTPDEKLYVFENLASVGFDFRQHNNGSVFDNILISDDVIHAKQACTDILVAQEIGEEEMKKSKERERYIKDIESIPPENDDEEAFHEGSAEYFPNAEYNNEYKSGTGTYFEDVAKTEKNTENNAAENNAAENRSKPETSALLIVAIASSTLVCLFIVIFILLFCTAPGKRYVKRSTSRPTEVEQPSTSDQRHTAQRGAIEIDYKRGTVQVVEADYINLGTAQGRNTQRITTELVEGDYIDLQTAQGRNINRFITQVDDSDYVTMQSAQGRHINHATTQM